MEENGRIVKLFIYKTHSNYFFVKDSRTKLEEISDMSLSPKSEAGFVSGSLKVSVW